MNKLKDKAIIESGAKTLFSNIPFVGTAISECLFDYKSRVKQERLNKFIEALGKYFENVSGQDLDLEFLKSEEFNGLFEMIIDRVVQTKSEMKRERFKKIIINSIGAKSVSDFAETFLNIISQLSEKQIEILDVYYEMFLEIYKVRKELYELSVEKIRYQELLKKTHASGISASIEVITAKEQSLRAGMEKFEKLGRASQFNIEKREFDFYMQDLVSKCLMRDTKGDGMGTPESIDYQITLFGEAFLEFLKA